MDSGAFAINLQQQASVNLSGLAFCCNKEKVTWTMETDPWMSFSKDVKTEKGAPPIRPNGVFQCVIPDSPRFKNGQKPTPFNKRYVSVRGLLKNVVYKNLKQEDGIAHFVVKVEQIAFLGGASNEAADAVTIPNKLDSERPFFSFQTSRACSIEL